MSVQRLLLAAAAAAVAVSAAAPPSTIQVGPAGPAHRVKVSADDLELLETGSAAGRVLLRKLQQGVGAPQLPPNSPAKGFFGPEPATSVWSARYERGLAGDGSDAAVAAAARAARARARSSSSSSSSLSSSSAEAPIPKELEAQKVFEAYVGNLEQSTIFDFDSSLSNTSVFYNRYYKSTSGVAAAEYIFSRVSDVARDQGAGRITVSKVHSQSWPQFSVIARIEGSSPDAAGRLVVGAHLDSVGRTSSSMAPGADDDGSGSSCLFALYSAMANGQWQPRHDVEFHWYSAEEGGLLGSKQIAGEYAALGVEVQAMLNMDMTGYGSNDDPIGIIEDNVNPALTALLEKLVAGYSSLKSVRTACGYACSDHASWTKYGYRSCMPAERAFRDSNPYIHSSNDVIKHLNFERAYGIARVALGFLVEMDRV